MTIKRSFLLILIALLAIFLFSSLTNAWLFVRSNNSLDSVNKEIRVVLSIIDPINHSRNLRVHLMEYMKQLEKGDVENANARLAGVETLVQKMDNAFTSYVQAPRLANEDALLAEYQHAWMAYKQQGIEPLIAAARNGDQAGFTNQLTTVAKLDRQYEITLDKVLALHEAYAKQLNSTAQQNFNFSVIVLVLFAVVFVFIIGLIYFLLKKYLLDSLLAAKEQCSKIAQGQLQYTVPVSATSRSEISDVMRSIEQMRLALIQIISQVRDSCHSVANASQEIAAGNIDLSSRTEQQASALTQTAASMEELSATVKQNTDNVYQATRLTQEAVKAAQTGDEVSKEVITTMSGITQSSRKIEEITTVINSIAFQTNILALNAAVEAARAGEEGRGFAVVAGEVRNLAQRSAAAAREIEGLIKDSVTSISQGSQQVTKTGEAIANIIDTVSRVNTLMQEVSTASDEQSRGILQIEQAVTEMDGVTQQNAALVQESASAASSLEEQVNYLKNTVAAFQLPAH
ncbi:methyl-accepting chemotaxis protein [Mixta theicola]|uniref:Methyl-accepting chemotaxis protein n=1 Tax=Mixta theicola TaxID=1458355 RepID=A0A2K1QB21_9GAMM|nr:methyl-accepting chemotaxis protein [Mixta theicola]PNS12231.1 methyl-accepting chemotaxis protein [Mixta theicola]GLR07986.1 methyl-accepting chemotaxis protein [Mixta theicola]